MHLLVSHSFISSLIWFWHFWVWWFKRLFNEKKQFLDSYVFWPHQLCTLRSISLEILFKGELKAHIHIIVPVNAVDVKDTHVVLVATLSTWKTRTWPLLRHCQCERRMRSLLYLRWIDTWMGCQRAVAEEPNANPWTHLISPNLVSLWRH